MDLEDIYAELGLDAEELEEDFEAYPVSKQVNDPSYDAPDLLKPVSERTSGP